MCSCKIQGNWFVVDDIQRELQGKRVNDDQKGFAVLWLLQTSNIQLFNWSVWFKHTQKKVPPSLIFFNVLFGANSPSCHCRWRRSRSSEVSALVPNTRCLWSRRPEGWRSRSLMSPKTWTRLEVERTRVPFMQYAQTWAISTTVCSSTSLEWAWAAWAAVLEGGGWGVRAAGGAVLLPRTGRLLRAGRLLAKRTAAQQSGFLRQ